MADIPVYLFLGFLDGGKTKFIHDTLCDERFQNGDKTLCILFEDGDEELDTSEYKGGENVTVIQNHRIGSHAVFTQQPQQLQVVTDGQNVE